MVGGQIGTSLDDQRWKEEGEKGEKLNYERRPSGGLNAREKGLQKVSVYWRRDSRVTNLPLERCQAIYIKAVSGPRSQSDDWVNTGTGHYSAISILPFLYQRCC